MSHSHQTAPVMVVLRSGAIIALNRCVATPVLAPEPAPTGANAPIPLFPSLLGGSDAVVTAAADWRSSAWSLLSEEEEDPEELLQAAMASAEDQSCIIVPPQFELIKPTGHPRALWMFNPKR